MASEVHESIRYSKEQVKKIYESRKADVVALLKQLCGNAPKDGLTLEIEYIEPSKFTVTKKGIINGEFLETPEEAVSYFTTNLEKFKRKQWPEWNSLDTYDSIVNAIALSAERGNIHLV